MTHKIIVELTDEEYSILKDRADIEHTSLSIIAGRFLRWVIDTMRGLK